MNKENLENLYNEYKQIKEQYLEILHLVREHEYKKYGTTSQREIYNTTDYINESSKLDIQFKELYKKYQKILNLLEEKLGDKIFKLSNGNYIGWCFNCDNYSLNEYKELK